MHADGGEARKGTDEWKTDDDDLRQIDTEAALHTIGTTLVKSV